MTARLSGLDDQKPGVNIQTKDHTLTLPSGQNGPEDPEAFGNAPSHSPSQSMARKPTPDWPETQYCLEIQVTSTEDGGVTPPPPHAWKGQSWLWKLNGVDTGGMEQGCLGPLGLMCLLVMIWVWPSCGRHGPRCQIQPYRSHSDQPR